jgi:ABC-type multidrug transport system ATPase subunit
MGPSGSGKSTLLNAIAGRVKQTPKLKLQGQVLVDGAQTRGQDEATETGAGMAASPND